MTNTKPSSVVSFSANRRSSSDRRHNTSERRQGERRTFNFDDEAGLMLAGLGFAHTPAMSFFPWRYNSHTHGVVRAWPMGDRVIVRMDEPERAPEGFNVDPHTGRLPLRQRTHDMEAIDAIRAKLEAFLD